MSETGDDCYFYYYSTCAKGDLCPFRHQPAALGCEVTCRLWEKGRCFKKACTFRHMVIEKERNTIPCFWESLEMGCTKINCPFLHIKTRQLGPVPQQSVLAATSTGIQVSSSASQNIPTIQGNAGPPNPHLAPVHPQGPRASGSIRPSMYNRPVVPLNQVPYIGGPRPIGYQGFSSRAQPSLLMYQMQNNPQHMVGMHYPRIPHAELMRNLMINHQRAGNLPYNNIGRRDDIHDESDGDYTSSDFSDVSLSDGEDEIKPRSKDYYHRRVHSPRHESSRREVRQRNSARDKKTENPRSSRESDKRHNRKKERTQQNDREKERSASRDAERIRTKSKKISDGGKASINERRKEKSPGKEKLEKDEKVDGDIKVKTLEEILREKALKNLHERTAQKKKAQMEAEKIAKDNDKDDDDDTNDNSPEPVIKSVVSVNKPESTASSKVSDPKEEADSSASDIKTKNIPEKKVPLRTAKSIIRSIIEPDNQTTSSSIAYASKKLVRKIIVESDETTKTQKGNITQENLNKETESTSSDKAITSDISTIKVKTLEEIRKEKQQRKEFINVKLDSKEKNLKKADASLPLVKELVSENEKKSWDVKPLKGRRIRVLKKGSEASKSIAINPAGEQLLRRNVDIITETVLMKKDKDVPIKDVIQLKADKSIVPNTTVKSKGKIFIKSFDEIMKEKRERQNKQEQAQLDNKDVKELTTLKKRINRQTIIKRKETKKPESQRGAPKKIISRKLKIVRQPGTLAKSNSSGDLDSLSRDSSLTSASHSQFKPVLDNKSVASCATHLTSSNPTLTEQPLTSKSKMEARKQTSCKNLEPRHSNNLKQDQSHDVEEDDHDDDDDESWQHEELPAVPMDTPTLEGSTFVIPTTNISIETPKAACIFHIPGKTNLGESPDQKISPTKRSRSSLEELFGVPCDDEIEKEQKPLTEQLPDFIDDDQDEISPPKRVKTYQETHEEIVNAVNREMSKKDDDFDLDLDLDLEEEIGNLSSDKSRDDLHEVYDEDDLLLELDEIIND